MGKSGIAQPTADPYVTLAKWVILASLIGFLTGLLISSLEIAILDFSEFMLIQVASSGLTWLIPVIPLAGISLTGALRYKLVRDPSLHGTEEVLDSYHNRGVST